MVKLHWLGTARVRFGTEIGGLWVYGTGGLAYGKLSISGTNNFRMIDATVATPFISNTQFEQSKIAFGYALGAGVEGAFGAGAWTWKIEYLYINLGMNSFNAFATSPPAVSVWFGPHSAFIDHIVRVGINHHFAPAPWP